MCIFDEPLDFDGRLMEDSRVANLSLSSAFTALTSVRSALCVETQPALAGKQSLSFITWTTSAKQWANSFSTLVLKAFGGFMGGLLSCDHRVRKTWKWEKTGNFSFGITLYSQTWLSSQPVTSFSHLYSRSTLTNLMWKRLFGPVQNQCADYFCFAVIFWVFMVVRRPFSCFMENQGVMVTVCLTCLCALMY